MAECSRLCHRHEMRRAVITGCVLLFASSCGGGESEAPGDAGSSPTETLPATPAKSLDTDGFEDELADQLQVQTGSGAKVVCPAEVEIGSGVTFDCTAEMVSGDVLTIRVTQRGDQGNLEWEVTNVES